MILSRIVNSEIYFKPGPSEIYDIEMCSKQFFRNFSNSSNHWNVDFKSLKNGFRILKSQKQIRTDDYILPK